MKYLKLTMILSITLIRSSPSYSMDAADYLNGYDLDRRTFGVFISGMGESMSWYNAALAAENKDRIYCPPASIAITTDQYVSIMKSFILKRPELSKSSVGLVLVMSLRNEFPCR